MQTKEITYFSLSVDRAEKRYADYKPAPKRKPATSVLSAQETCGKVAATV